MRRLLSAIISISIVLTLLCSCGTSNSSSKYTVNIKSASIDKYFANSISVTNVLNDLKIIDLYAKMDVDKSFTSSTETDSENSTSITHYYKNNVLVYSDYNGYGEDTFKFYKKLETDKDAVVTYQDDDGKRKHVSIDCKYSSGEKYSLSTVYNGLDKSLPYGIKAFYLTIYTGAGILPVYKTYYVTSKKTKVTATIVNARYFGDDNCYHEYSVSMDDSGFTSPDDVVLYSPFDGNENICGDTELPKLISSVKGVKSIEIKLDYGTDFSWKTEGAETEWYITTKIYILFNDAKSRDLFAEKYTSGKSESYKDTYSEPAVNYPCLTSTATLRIADDAVFDGFDSIADIISNEWDTSRSYRVSFNSDGSVNALTTDSIMRWD